MHAVPGNRIVSSRKSCFNLIKIIFFIFTGLFVFIPDIVSAVDPDHDHDSFHQNHLGVGVAAADIFGENELYPSLHLHYIRQFGEDKLWGLGVGYEAVLEESVHSGIYLIYNRHIFNKLSINFAPGITYGRHHNKNGINPALHFESLYEFDAGNFHLGPMIGFGIDPRDSHISFGLHFGFGF